MKYYAGIDGGQSTTKAVVADQDGRILGRGNAGPADEVDENAGSTRLHDALAAALDDAIAHANLPTDTRFASIVAGISGYEGRVYGKPPELPTEAITLEHDAPIAHAGAFGGEAGVIVIAGTGSVAYATNDDGANALIGGWGYLFGDEGGAFSLSRDAISDAMRNSDAEVADDLTQIALQYFSVPSLRALSRAFYSGSISRAQFASFASVIVEQAEDFNEQAAQYVKDAASALVTLAMRAMERVALQSPKVAYVGGMFESATVRDQVAQRMREVVPQAQHIQPRYDAAIGALLMAYKAAGIDAQIVVQ
jgi:N-acetylglucosamine kinase-like BadF-type ATPase